MPAYGGGMEIFMKTRILTALVLVPLLIILLASPDFVIAIAVSIVSAVGLYELYKATGVINNRALSAIGFVAGIIVTFAVYIPAQCYMSLFFIFILASFLVLLKTHKKTSIEDFAVAIFGVLYVPLLLSTLTLTTMLDETRFPLYAIFIGAFSTDTFAYFTGVFFGKHKLCPDISPKKTIEGSIGGAVGCVLLMLLYAFILNKYFMQSISYAEISVLGVLIAVVSQIGDLTASIIKRKFGVKDYGSLFPGHGGILDRLDSIITTAPLVYCFVSLFGF